MLSDRRAGLKRPAIGCCLAGVRDQEETKRVECLVIGAGLAGIAAARKLAATGWSCRLLEKSRGIGGRLATRRLDGESFDHGAQFLTAQDPQFLQEVQAWRDRGWVAPWFGEETRQRFLGRPSMSGLAKRLAEGLDVCNQKMVTTIEFRDSEWTAHCEDGTRFAGRRLLVTSPAPQALALFERSELSLSSALQQELAAVRYEKTVALLLRLEAPSGMAAPGFKRFDVPEPIATIADCQLKGTSAQPGVVIHSGHGFAAEHYEREPEWLIEALTREAQARLRLEVVESYLHKWRYAHRSSPDADTPFRKEKGLPLWLAGDSFGAAKVEGAYVSGVAAAEAMLRRG